MGFPLMTIMFLILSIEPIEWKEHDHFVAETRKGSTLRFSTKEQFLI